MPHIIVEYAHSILSDDEALNILKSLHLACVDSDLFDESHIKTRAYPFFLGTLAGGHEPYLHIQVRILSGRCAADKKRLSESMINSLTHLKIKAAVVTLEVIDMDRDSYVKLKP